MIAGVPYAPVSPPYSLVAKDFAKLKIDPRDPDAGPRLRQRRDAVRRARSKRPRQRRWRSSRASIRRKAGRRPASKPSSQAGRAGSRRGAGEGRPGHGRQAPVHLRLDRRAQGRDQHPSDDDLEPGDAQGGQSELWRRAAGAGRLAALEPHVRRQQQLQPGAVERRLLLYRRREAVARRDRGDGAATCARCRRPSITMCRKASRCCCPTSRRTSSLRKSLFVRLQSFVYAGAALAPHVREEFEAARARNGRPCRADSDLARLDGDRAFGDQRHRKGASSPAWSASPIPASN